LKQDVFLIHREMTEKESDKRRVMAMRCEVVLEEVSPQKVTSTENSELAGFRSRLGQHPLGLIK